VAHAQMTAQHGVLPFTVSARTTLVPRLSCFIGDNRQYGHERPIWDKLHWHPQIPVPARPLHPEKTTDAATF